MCPGMEKHFFAGSGFKQNPGPDFEQKKKYENICIYTDKF